MFLENKNKKIAQGMGSTRSVRLATRYEKARQDAGVFYCLILSANPYYVNFKKSLNFLVMYS